MPAPRPDPSWWRYVPLRERAERRRTLQRLRLQAWLGRRPLQIALLLGVYLLLCLLPLLLGLGSLAVLAVLPLLLAPPLAYLVYWLLWQEFNG